MSVGDSNNHKSFFAKLPYIQIFCVFLAFALMVIASYLFTGNIIREHLRRETDAVLNIVESHISSNLDDMKILLAEFEDESIYLFLLDSDYTLMVHPEDYLIGLHLRNAPGGFSDIADELEREHQIIEKELKNYSNEMKVVSIRPVENGWYLGIATRIDSYYANLRNMQLFLFIFGFVMASGLSAILIRLNYKKNVALKKAQLANNALERFRAQVTTFAMFDSNPHINILFDDHFRVIDCNTSAMRFMEFESKEEMLAGFAERLVKSLPKVQPDGRITTTLEERLKTATTEGVDKFVTELHLPGKRTILDIEFRKIPYEDSFAIIAYAHDITEMHKRERELINAQYTNELQLTKLNAVVKATKIGLYDVGITNNDFLHPDNTVTFTNEFRNMLGYTDKNDFPDSLTIWKDHLHPEDRDRAIEEVIEHVSDKTGNMHYDKEYRLLRKDGEYSYFRACGEAIRDENGNVLRIAGALMDITETRRRELSLRQAYEMNKLQLAKIDLINKAARIGLWDMEIIRDDPMNIKNSITYSNEFREILGYSDENDFPNQISSFNNCLHPDDFQMVTDILNNHINDSTGKTPFNPEYQAKKKNGEYVYVRATGESIRDENGYAIRTMGTIMDISDEMNTISNTEKLLLAAEEANKAKSVFLANMSHEIRTPLNAVIGLSDLVLGTDSGLNSESRYRLEQINSAGSTLLSTVNDILDISKIEAGKFELLAYQYDIPSMINDAVTQSILHKGEKPIEFIMHVSEDLPTHLIGDELRIKQILTNFLSNAFKYTMSGKIELTVSCSRDGEKVWLSFIVVDTGIGIRQEDLENLFSDYVQMDMSANRKIIGTGLGLPIAKRLVEQMDGQITVESEYGKGSTFSVRVMQKYVNNDVIGPDVTNSLKQLNYSEVKRRQTGKLMRLNMPYARVLIVDDVITNLDVARGLMKPYHMHIDCVTSGQEAIEAVLDKRVRYNAIFMDHMMPGMDGIEATRHIREIGTDYATNIPIIALTANAIVGNEEMFLENGFQAFISKPIEIASLDNVIREWVRDKEQEKLYTRTEWQQLPVQEDDMNWQALENGIEGINVEKGLARFYGDKSAYTDVMRSYAKNTIPLLEEAQKVSKENLESYATVVHGIKGSSGGISAYEVAAIAEALENAAISGDYKYIKANNKNLIDSVKRLISNIEATVDNIDSDNRKPKQDSPDSDILNNLLQACTDYDMRQVDAALEELEAYDYVSNGELVIWLRDNVEQMNFDEIIDRLSATDV